MTSKANTSTVVVVTGGAAPGAQSVAGLLAGVPEGFTVVAADSGLEHALAAGLTVAHAVGDFDSVDPSVLAAAAAGGTQVHRHPVDKDATDLELALLMAEGLGARRVVVLGGHGGRLDHFLGNVMVLAAPRFENLVVEAVMGDALVRVARPWGPSVVRGAPGDVVTLLPVHGPAEGVTTVGLLYALDRETLAMGTTRGVSNELCAAEAEVRLTAGCLLIVQPGATGTHLHTRLDQSSVPPSEGQS